MGKIWELILLNDNENSFEDVIFSIVETLGFTLFQGEQLATLVHHKGEIVVTSGTKAKIKKMLNLLESDGLNVKMKLKEL